MVSRFSGAIWKRSSALKSHIGYKLIHALSVMGSLGWARTARLVRCLPQFNVFGGVLSEYILKIAISLKSSLVL